MSFRNFVRQLVLKTPAFHSPSVNYAAEHALLPEIFVRTPPEKLREVLFLPASEHRTQLNQDLFGLLHNRFRPGYFLEIGANDGFTLSNTIYLEQHFGWKGLLVEANPEYRESLARRQADVMLAAVVEKEGHYTFRSAGLFGGLADTLDPAHAGRTQQSRTIEVWGTTLRRILEEKQAPRTIDFVSIDVEGAEVPIVEQLCGLADFRFGSGCIEHNGRDEDYRRIASLLEGAGYRIAWPRQTQHDLFFVDGRR